MRCLDQRAIVARSTRPASAMTRDASTTRSSKAIGAALLFAAAIAGAPAHGQKALSGWVAEIPTFVCDSDMLEPALGPCDYRKPTDTCPNNRGVPDLLRNVEYNHFPPRIERLQGNPGTFEGEIQYTLNVFPNHPRALASLWRLAGKRRSDTIPAMKYTATCWFVRAALFAPDDARVRELFGLHLSRFDGKDEALKQMLAAEALGGAGPNNLYNIGLLYFGKRDYEKALAYAKRAYAGGFPLPGLRDMLKRAGKWQD
jgi:hypothetical protein